MISVAIVMRLDWAIASDAAGLVRTLMLPRFPG